MIFLLYSPVFWWSLGDIGYREEALFLRLYIYVYIIILLYICIYSFYVYIYISCIYNTPPPTVPESLAPLHSLGGVERGVHHGEIFHTEKLFPSTFVKTAAYSCWEEQETCLSPFAW